MVKAAESQQSTDRSQRLTQASDVSYDATRADMAEWSQQWHQQQCWGAWLEDAARGSAWWYNPDVQWCVGHVSHNAKPLSDAWRPMWSLMASRLPQVCKSTQDDLSGTCRKLIGVIFAAMMQRVVVFAMWNSSTATAAGPEPKDNGWKTSEVQRWEAAAAAVMAEVMLRME